jgi:PDDEXK-like domain of unknown function (DUF3799)
MSIIHDESIHDYHRNLAVGSTLAKDARKSLQLFHDRHSGLAPAGPDKPSWQVGRIVHMRTLEPARYAECVVTRGPINPKTNKEYGRDTKAFEDWQLANPGLIMVEPYIDMMCARMPEEVKEILRDGRPEVTIRTDYSDALTIQCRPDWMRGNDDWDLKTIDDVDKWQLAVRRLSYWFSAGWYKMTKQRTGEFNGVGEWRWIFCEKAWPYRWRLVRMSAGYIERAMDEAEKVAQRISDAMHTDDWSDADAGEIVAELPIELDDQEFTTTESGSISI